ncbi:hypothetical protein AB0428_30875, partial [Streptomyces virginiae]
MPGEVSERRRAHEDAGEPGAEQQALTAFLGRIDALAAPAGAGTQQLSIEAFRELVGSDPERSAAACRHLLDKARARTGTWHAFAQLAVVIAALYDLEYDDDTLTDWVEAELDATGITVRPPEVIPSEQELNPPNQGPLLFPVSLDRVEASDVYPFVVAFSPRAQEWGLERV